MQILHPVTQSVTGSLWVASHLKCMYRPWSWQGLGSKIQSFDLWLSSSLLARSETKVQIAQVAKLLHHGCQSHSSSHTHLRHLDDSACSVKYCTTKMRRAVLRCSVDCVEHYFLSGIAAVTNTLLAAAVLCLCMCLCVPVRPEYFTYAYGHSWVFPLCFLIYSICISNSWSI